MAADLEPPAFERLLGHMAESVAVYRHDARVVYVNAAAERMLGAALPALAGHRLWDLYPGKIDSRFRAAFDQVVATGEPCELEHYCATFGKWWASRLSRDGEHVVVVGREVTSHRHNWRRTEALARISEVVTADELDFSKVTARLAHILTEIMDADCSLAMLSSDRVWLELAATAMREPVRREVSSVMRFPADRGHPGEALRERRAVLATFESLQAEASVAQSDIKRAVAEYKPSSLVVVPLTADDEPIGVMMAVRHTGQASLTEEDSQLAIDLSASIGLYLAHTRRRAEAAWLRTRLAAVTDGNPALVSIIDRERRYLYVNASYERWFGQPRDHFVGKKLEDVIGPAAFAVVVNPLERAFAGEEVHYETSIPYPSGERYIDVRYVPIRGETGVESVAALVLDLTAEQQLALAEQRRAEDQKRSTRRLESLLAVTGKLAGAAHEAEIAQIFVEEGMEGLEASLGALWFARPDGTFELIGERGYSPEHVHAYRHMPIRAGEPLGDCVLGMRSLWIESRADYAARYPELEARFRPEDAPPLALGIVPLVSEGSAIGVASFAFHDERRLDTDERTYLELLASHVAQALRRARIYAELVEASQTREAIIQASPAATFLVDEHGIIHAWNPAAERIFGWTAAEAIGNFLPWASVERQAAIAESVRGVIAGTPIHDGRTQWPDRAGELLDIELHAVAVRTANGLTRCLAMAFDISQRMRFERGRELVANASAILSRSLDLDETLHQILKLPLEHFSDFSSVDLLTADGQLERLAYGPSPLPEHSRRLAHHPRFDGASLAIDSRRPRLLHDLDDATLRRIARDEQHYAALASSGARSVLSVPLLVGDHALGAISLISKLRNFDDIDVQIVTDLASRAAVAIDNARLYRSAQQARRDAEAADRAKDQFLAMLGHELRNPLAPIVTALHLMKMRYPSVAERERAVIERQTSHLTRLVDDLLDISRITRGKIELHRERVAVGGVIARAIEITSPMFEQRRHRITLDVPQDLAIDGDPTRLDQVLANLMSNAAKYTEPGGQIRVHAKREADRVVLVVEDTGVGIAPEMLPNVFDVFVQAPQQSARTQGGLGLGLAIVKSIVELHGGSVTARSGGVGQGTTIEVVLPAAADAVGAEASGQAVQPHRNGWRILVVDDNRDAATMLSEVLDSYGHEIRTAYDGPTALEIAAELRPEIAILDIGLPVMDGYELAHRLRALAPLRLIAVTGYGQPSDRERAREAGFEAHVAKPVSIERLIDLLEAPVSS